MEKMTEAAPYGVTVIQLENFDEALYLHGDCLACASYAEKDAPVCGVGERLAEALGVPFKLLTLPIPKIEEWAWNDVVESLGWGKSNALCVRVVRPVLECSTSHITLTDNHILGNMTRNLSSREWVHNTGMGFMIRLDAVRFPLLKLKRNELSRAARWVIWQGMKQANISMIHFSANGDCLDGVQTFEW
ncbi:hypothetical protein CIG19_20350 [Enterobacterales bacterium CwR94]|nr:hypothetical protein CIG19_20350 [Enterobacterales bacterium CwR94]